MFIDTLSSFVRTRTRTIASVALLAASLGCKSDHDSRPTPPQTPRVEIVATRFLTNAAIFCSATHLPDFNDSHVGKVFALPYEGGPNMEYGQQTAGRAITHASLASRGELFECVSDIGGKCGPNGSNKGGWGRVSPQLDGVLRVTGAGPGGARVVLTLTLSPRDVATEPGTPNLITMTIPALGLQRTITAQELANPVLVVLNGVRTGDLDFTLTTATLVQGCFGAAEGTYPRKNVALGMRAAVAP